MSSKGSLIQRRKIEISKYHKLIISWHNTAITLGSVQIAEDKRRVLEGLKEEFDIAIRRAEEEDEMLRDRGSRMQNRVSQRKEEIEAAFDRIEKAVSYTHC